MLSDGKFRCPGCGGLDVRHSLRRGAIDSLMLMFHRTPFRCRRCDRRFYSALNRPQTAMEPGTRTLNQNGPLAAQTRRTETPAS
jgi:hypothetical protein